ncbi:hypothetical protein [Leucobacter musarum]|uniref:hypothetical protein n=1 Tax=Leucobacter musarum TaxID=1930747 RepID=UPI0006A782DE|nr:hypothetical protein [Leucobacter musarum]
MNNEVINAESDAVAPKRSTKKRNTWIAAGVVAALAVGGAIATPFLLQQQRDNQWQSLRADLKSTLGKTVGAEGDLEAALALSSLQYTEASTFVKNVRELGKAADPIFTKDQAKSLSQTADTAQKALGDAPEKSDQRTAAVKTVEAEVKQLREADKAAATKAKKAKKDAPKTTAPGSYLALSGDDVRDLIADTKDANVDLPKKPEHISDEDLNAAEKALRKAKSVLKEVRAAVKSEAGLSTRYTDAVAGSLPALVKVSDQAPKQAKSVVAGAPKAAAEGKVVTASAKSVKVLADDDAVTALSLQRKLSEYVSAAKSAQKTQTDQVAAEAAAAAAAESGAAWDGGAEAAWNGQDAGTGAGYDAGWNSGGGNGGGSYDTGWNNNGGGDQTWTPPVDTGNGGGGGETWTPPADTGNGGGSSSGGGGGGGGTTPATSCPPGTYPTGSWDNITGVHCLANGTDEGW